MSRELVEYFPFVGADRGRERSPKTCGEGVVKVTTTATARLTTIVSTYRIQKLVVAFLVDPASPVQPVERNLGGNTKATRNLTVGLLGSRLIERCQGIVAALALLHGYTMPPH